MKLVPSFWRIHNCNWEKHKQTKIQRKEKWIKTTLSTIFIFPHRYFVCTMVVVMAHLPNAQVCFLQLDSRAKSAIIVKCFVVVLTIIIVHLYGIACRNRRSNVSWSTEVASSYNIIKLFLQHTNQIACCWRFDLLLNWNTS